MTKAPHGKTLIAKRLEDATTELTKLKEAIHTGDLDARVLREFRWAVDHIRLSAWAVARWMEEEKERGDPYRILPFLVAERVRRATSLANDLAADLTAHEVSVETPGLAELFGATQRLLDSLKPLVQKEGQVPSRLTWEEK